MLRTPRRAATRTPQQIVADLAALTREWAESRPEGVCDALLIELATVRPDLCCSPGSCELHRS